MSERRVAGRIYGMKYSWKGHKDRNRHKNRIKRSGQTRLVCFYKPQHPHHVKVSPRGRFKKDTNTKVALIFKVIFPLSETRIIPSKVILIFKVSLISTWHPSTTNKMIYMVVLMMVFSSYARILWEGSTNHSPPALLLPFLDEGQLMRTNSTKFWNDNSLQWC